MPQTQSAVPRVRKEGTSEAHSLSFQNHYCNFSSFKQLRDQEKAEPPSLLIRPCQSLASFQTEAGIRKEGRIDRKGRRIDRKERRKGKGREGGDLGIWKNLAHQHPSLRNCP